MARTIADIQATMIAAKVADGTLSGLTSSSTVAMWRLWIYIVAVCQWTLEGLFDAHKAEVAALIKAEKAHTLGWYITMAKRFQNGDTLPADTDTYDPVAEAGDASLIVTFVAAVEFAGMVRLKVATGVPGALAALSGPQLTSFNTYMGRVKDAGVRLQGTSAAGDTFRPTMVVYYDPLILDATGARIDGSAATPVEDAVNAFLAGIDFNRGVLRYNDFVAAMEAIEGVVIAHGVLLQAFYGAVTPVTISTEYEPDAGYLVLDGAWFAANVSYVAYTL